MAERGKPNRAIQSEVFYSVAYHDQVKKRLAAGDIPHIAYFSSQSPSIWMNW